MGNQRGQATRACPLAPNSCCRAARQQRAISRSIYSAEATTEAHLSPLEVQWGCRSGGKTAHWSRWHPGCWRPIVVLPGPPDPQAAARAGPAAPCLLLLLLLVAVLPAIPLGAEALESCGCQCPAAIPVAQEALPPLPLPLPLPQQRLLSAAGRGRRLHR